MHLAAVVVASIMLASMQPARAENYCAETQAHAETPLPDYLAYYRSVAAAKPDESLYIRGEKELQASGAWLADAMVKPGFFDHPCGQDVVNVQDLLVVLSAVVEYRHGAGLLSRGIALRPNLDFLEGLKKWIDADPKLGAPLYRYMLYGLRDAYVDSGLPMPVELRALPKSQP